MRVIPRDDKKVSEKVGLLVILARNKPGLLNREGGRAGVQSAAWRGGGAGVQSAA
jgi:hypothetical protein